MMKTCLSALLFIRSVSTAYVLNKAQSLPSANYTAVAMAFRPITVNGGAFDVALGLANGTVLLTNIDNFESRTSFQAFSGLPIAEIEWTEFGIFVLSTKGLKVWDVSSLKPMVQLSFTEPIERASVGYQGTGAGRIITAVSFIDRIQVYEDTTLVMNRPTGSTCRALAVDHTTKFLHYFDSQVRFIVNIQTRSDLVNVTTTTSHIGLVGASAANRENITMSLNSAGGLEVWDQSVLLFAEPAAATAQTQLKLTDNSDQLFTYSPADSVIAVWPIDYSKLTSCSKSQEISQLGSSPNNARPLPMDAKNNRFVYLSGGSLMVYVPDRSSNWLILLAVLVALVCCCGLCLVVNKKCGIRNLLTKFAYRGKQIKIEEDSAKYAKLQQNNNINQSYGLHENEQINSSISAKNTNTI